ncbi:MAG: helix-turn-helix domain-containing protein, partial [Kiritimatiellae bacterium]|nr:helix-turn-helix domain-containing protein [Kiritimatiellia bacterium]
LQNVIASSGIMAREPVFRTPLLSMGIEKKRAETGFSIPEGMSFSELEKEILSQLLSRYEGNRTLTAEKLGISRRTIQRKIKEHNLPY